MQLSAVHLARVLFFLEVAELNPRGFAYYPAIVSALVKQFGFAKFPDKPEDFDESKGIFFEGGYFADTTLDRLVIYENGLQLDTRRNTEHSEKILLSALTWAKEINLTFQPGMVKRKAYVSQFGFYSDAPLLGKSPLLNSFSERISKTVSDNMKAAVTFQPTAILIGQDPNAQTIPVASFSIERRAQTPFHENKYFSSAPVPTEMHFQMVEEYEKAILTNR